MLNCYQKKEGAEKITDHINYLFLLNAIVRELQ